MDTYICIMCKEALPGSEFSENNFSGRGKQYYCKTCESKRRKEYYAANPEKLEKMREQQRQWKRERRQQLAHEKRVQRRTTASERAI